MYTTNLSMPRVRRDAARMLRNGYSTRAVARHIGFSQRVIVIWSRKAQAIGGHPIPTKSSRSKNSPNRLPKDIRDCVSAKRKELGRSIEVVHYALKEEGVTVTFSSVYRILPDRYSLKRKSPWKKLHYATMRPIVLKPRHLVQMDIVTGDGDFYYLVQYLLEQNKLTTVLIPNRDKYSGLLKRFAKKHIAFMNDLEQKVGKQYKNAA